MIMRYFVLLFSFLAAFAIPTSSNGQHLRRQMMWGIWPQPIPESLATEAGTMGIYVARIFPEGTAGPIQLKEGDIIRKIQGNEVAGPQSLGKSSFKFFEGDALTLEIWRGGKTIKLTGKAVGKPLETHPTADVIYGEVPFQNGFLRTIVTKPKSVEKAPVVFWVPGYTCASYDRMPQGHPYKAFIDGLTDLGYIVFRTEKPGMGDCNGTPHCTEIDFATEQSAFEAGYEAMLNLDYIDKDNIFILGHSMGGLQGPLLAQKYHPKGLFVYGTRHETWHEYILAMLRFQNPRNGVDFIQHEKEMELYTQMMYEHYVLKKSPKEIANTPEKAALLKRDFFWDGDEQFFGRHYKFMQDLQDLKMGEVWANLDCHVLSMFGEADFEALNSFSHEEIVRIVNHYHPGMAEYQFLPGTDHGFRKVGTMDQGVLVSQGQAPPGEFNAEVVDRVHTWMQHCMKHH